MSGVERQNEKGDVPIMMVDHIMVEERWERGKELGGKTYKEVALEKGHLDQEELVAYHWTMNGITYQVWLISFSEILDLVFENLQKPNKNEDGPRVAGAQYAR